jgi:hypothetical protein
MKKFWEWIKTTVSKIPSWVRFVGLYLTIWIVVLTGLLIYLWPRCTDSPPGTLNSNTPTIQSSDSGRVENEDDPSEETAQPDSGSQKSNPVLPLMVRCPISCKRFVELVLIMGALGACLHGITSLTYHRGRGKFSKDWTLWYLCRPFVGGVLALIFYLIINGGLTSQIDGKDKKFFGILGISGLIGLFSKQALNKLSIIFDAIFAGDKDYDDKKKEQKSPDTSDEPGESPKEEPKEVNPS